MDAQLPVPADPGRYAHDIAILKRVGVQGWRWNCEQRNEYQLMIATHLPFVLAASFGTGIGVGISTGLVTGLLFGAAAGAASVSKKIRQKLTASIETGDISVVDKNGQPMTAESIAVFLNEKSNKA